MRAVFYMFFLLLVSCASARTRHAELSESITRSWRGKNIAELKAHRYLSTLEFARHADRADFIKASHFNSKARCQGLGGCMGMPFEAGCVHSFYLQDEVVAKYGADGDCFSEMEWLRKTSPQQD